MMEKGKTITVGGRSLPARQTLGAMVRFKEMTGKEVTEIRADSLTELATYVYCLVSSACAADGIEFGMTFQEFADRLTPDELTAWSGSQAVTDADAPQSKGKKKASR